MEPVKNTNPVFKVGDRVCKGPDWKWESQGGLDPKGTVTEGFWVGDEKWVGVKWDNGNQYGYRNYPGAQDLCLLREASDWNSSDADMDDEDILRAAGVEFEDISEGPQQDPVEAKRDTVVTKPSHYTKFLIEPITFIMRNDIEFWRGNIIKYASRAGSKMYDGMDEVQSEITDLEKVRRYAEMRINQLQGEEIL